MNDDKLKITLRIADLKTPLALRVDYGADEKYWRDAADLFNKRWAFYKDKYKDGLMDSESMMAIDRKSTRLNSSHASKSRMPSSA